jgi:hypothetical protein
MRGLMSVHVRVARDHLELLVQTLATDNKDPAETLSFAAAATAARSVLVSGVFTAVRRVPSACELLADLEDLQCELTCWKKDERTGAKGSRVGAAEPLDERDHVCERLAGAGAGHADEVAGWVLEEGGDSQTLDRRGCAVAL